MHFSIKKLAENGIRIRKECCLDLSVVKMLNVMEFASAFVCTCTQVNISPCGVKAL